MVAVRNTIGGCPIGFSAFAKAPEKSGSNRWIRKQCKPYEYWKCGNIIMPVLIWLEFLEIEEKNEMDTSLQSIFTKTIWSGLQVNVVVISLYEYNGECYVESVLLIS